LPQVPQLTEWFIAEARRLGRPVPSTAQARRMARWAHVQRRALIEAAIGDMWESKTALR
jgi:hypothetical protein